MKNRYQKIQSYTFDTGRGGPGEHTERSSYKTLEKAIENDWFWITKEEAWIDTTVTHIEIVDKETKEIVWTYTANPN